MKEMIKKLSWKNLSWKGRLKLVLVILFLLWLGVPTFNKWKADKLVDELCAKDGGVKVYETVTLPKERFNEWGKLDINAAGYKRIADQYEYTLTHIDLKGVSNSYNIGGLVVYKLTTKILRLQDKKILGELTSYVRRGGDPWGPWHPSSYSCPENDNFSEKIFLVENK